MTNPLLTPSHLPYELPDFARICDEHYLEAIQSGIEQHHDEIRAIIENPETATFENTLVEMEKAGALLNVAVRVFFSTVSADSSPKLRELESTIKPAITAHYNSIQLNQQLFERIQFVYDHQRDQLEGEDRQLLEQIYLEFTRNGAGLEESARTKLAELNTKISELTTTFGRNLLEETNSSAVIFDHIEELDGASEDQISAFRAAAAEQDLDNKYLVSLVLPTSQPIMEVLTNRDSRRRIHEAAISRGNRHNEFDTNALVLELVKLRAERAVLLGQPNHASAVLVGSTAQNTAAIEKQVYSMAAPAAANVVAEAAELQQIADAEADDLGIARFTIQAWDWSYYTKKLREQKFDLDTAKLKPYFEYNRVLIDGVFYAAHQLYGLDFVERKDLSGYHPDVRIFEVFDEEHAGIGLFLHDVYARPSKRGGAWMNNLVDQSILLGQKPVICNNLNVSKPGSGPTLLTLDEVSTMFHEFGHALHGLLSSCRYSKLSGTSVPRDFVEFPSQVNEMWLDWTEVINNYAKHYQTGETLPAEMIAKVQAQATFNQGYQTATYLGSALLDQEWHKISPDQQISSVQEFEKSALAKVGLDNPLAPPRYTSTFFSHTFSGGYDAGYYSYIWSEVLDADTVAWFKENGGLTRENGRRLCEELLCRGMSRDLMESYRSFRGRDADPRYLLQRRGITAAQAAS